jgi:hypothetical protein
MHFQERRSAKLDKETFVGVSKEELEEDRARIHAHHRDR